MRSGELFKHLLSMPSSQLPFGDSGMHSPQIKRSRYNFYLPAYSQFNVRRPDDSLRDHWQGMTNYIDNASFDTFLQQNYADKLLSLQRM
jgi:hypothetical protein